MQKRAILAALFGAAIVAASCSEPPPARVAPGLTPTLAQLPDVDMDAVLAHTRTLSSDEFEGRAPGTDGERRTVDYLVGEFTKAGLKPGNTDGTYVQKVPLVGITPTPAPLVFRKGAVQQRLKWKDDFVAWTKHVADAASLDASELVFRRLRRGGAGVPVGRLQGPGRERQDDRHARERSAGAGRVEPRDARSRRPSAARR